MIENKIAIDGAPDDGVGHTNVGPDVLERYKEASDLLAQFKVRPLTSGTDPRERLYLVAFDGTGNSKFNDPMHATNVAKIYDELIGEDGNRFSHFTGTYIEGSGTQKDFFEAKLDAVRGSSYKANIERAYERLVIQANRWAAKDSDIDVRVKSIGFSRGASQVPGFARLLHERGIPDLESKVTQPDGSFRYDRYIGEPGKVLQAVGLFDPVATGVPLDFDRRLPPSVISGLQITAMDEKRMLFLSDEVIPPGLSEDGRFLNLQVPGAHSDVGGGYGRDGLSIRCGNLMRDYCNALSAVPYLQKKHEPTDVRLNVIHRSKEGEMIFRLDPRDAVRGTPEGTSRILFPADAGHAGSVPHLPEPVDKRLLEGLPSKPVAIGETKLTSDRPSLGPATNEAINEAGRSVPLAPKVVRGLGAVTSVVDTVNVARDVRERLDDGNETSANSHMLHFASRNAAGWAGIQAGLLAGGAMGIESGPGLLVTGGLGGLAGGVVGDRLADAVDAYRIHHQRGRDGRPWVLNESSVWELDMPPVPGVPNWKPERASGEEASWLDYQASSMATEMALGRDYAPKDPYVQLSSQRDTPSLRDAPWKHDPQTHQWSRDVAVGWQEHGHMLRRREVASPERAAQLDEAAERTIMENLAESSRSVAMRYQATYEHEGWGRHGPMPEVVSRALAKPMEKVMASDGHGYTRDGEGEWSRPGWFGSTSHPEGLVKEELDASEHLTRMAISAEPAWETQSSTPSRLDSVGHPDHSLYLQTRRRVVELDASLGRQPDQHTDNIASALVVQARMEGLSRIDKVWLTPDGTKMWGEQFSPRGEEYTWESKYLQVMTKEANTPMEQSGARWPEAMRMFEQQEQQEADLKQQRLQERMTERSIGGPSMSR
ncbi:XVIPCD domain-containing protein [Luteibacter sp. CQ10]|uniref:XVIPCD domain-containing protein n=1 Tax=Luteibacter sp. CQ10 TaxID=2805821 RepID=UPI0034A17957